MFALSTDQQEISRRFFFFHILKPAVSIVFLPGTVFITICILTRCAEPDG
jgi:hypothetical protein